MKDKILQAVKVHGENIKAVFGLPSSVDPVNLCRKLRRIERKGAAWALRSCNGPVWVNEEARESAGSAILRELDSVLGFKASGVPVFLNGDPRGYALKIDDAWMIENSVRDCVQRLHRDFGGYGIMAPDLSE